MESKVWVINDPNVKEEKPKQKPVRIYFIVTIVMVIAVVGYFAYKYLLASGNEEIVDKVLSAKNNSSIKVNQDKNNSEVALRAYTVEDIAVTNEKLLTWSDVDRRVKQMGGVNDSSVKNNPVCPYGYEILTVERIYFMEIYCYSPKKKSFLLQRKDILDGIYTVTNYEYDKNRKTDSFKQITERYLLNGQKISE
jgi:hypothetical protein